MKRKLVKYGFVVVLAVIAVVILRIALRPPVTQLYINGKVLTMDSRSSIAEAVAVRDGRIVAVGPDERIGPMQALRAVTIDAAWQVFREDDIGSIEVGKHADLIVLSADPLEDPLEIRNIEVDKTIIGGKTVYERAHSPGA